MDDWEEVGRIAFPTPPQMDHSRVVTTLAFDTIQELLWTGNDRGRVMSFYATEMAPYTSFRIQHQADGPVRQFLFHDKGVLCLGPRSVHLYTRRGVKLWQIRHEKMVNLHCMSFTSRGTSEILVAGLQNVMFVIEVNRGEIVKQVPTEHQYIFLKKSRYVCAALQTGLVDLLDTVTLKVVKSWQAHVAYINDMDAQTDFIVTCGGSLKQQAQQVHMLDPYVNVFDLRNMTSMNPIPFPPLAAYVRMHPRMLTTSIVVSQQGQMHVVDLMNPNTSNVRYANVLSFLNMVEIAPSGEALALVDSEASIHLWGSQGKVHFTDFPTPTEFVDPVQPYPTMDWLPETPLSTVGLPYYRERLLSALPDTLKSTVGAPPKPIDPVLLPTLKQTEWGLYGKRPKAAPLEEVRPVEKMLATLQAPKFLSEKAREKARESAMSLDLESAAKIAWDQTADVSWSNSGQELESSRPDIAPMYRNLDIKYSKFGVDDFDFGFYNQTPYAGLENHIANSYANSLVQVMHYTPLLRNLALQHAASACLSDPCLLCELGYVFDMLQKASVSTCQATNLLKTLSKYPQAGQLLLLDEEHAGQPCTAMNQGLLRFLFDKINNEYRTAVPASTALEQRILALPEPVNPNDLLARLFGIEAMNMVKCTTCRVETCRQGSSYAVDMMYPPQRSPPVRPKPTRVQFSQALKLSVEREQTNKGWCNSCQRYQSIKSRKTIHSIPAVLAVNTAINSQDHMHYWTTPNWLPEEIGIIVDHGQFFCYEGEDLQLHLQRGMHNISVYSLVGLVVNIESVPPDKAHLVAMVNVSHSEPSPPGESRWHLFNDFSVRPVSSAEALRFNTRWKLPSSLVYQLKAANNQQNCEWKSRLNTALLFSDLSPHFPGKTYRVLDPRTEVPGPDTIVALDTEFVSLKQPEMHVNADGEKETIRPMSHALARVSVVRGQGELEGVPFIDDYIAIQDPVVDYLTLYSGITPADLDPRTSKHHLVGLKVAYKKLWILLNLGCKFLGHGLKQDFRVINIQVPKAQVIDTIDRFYLQSRLRKLSLAFLAWYLLKEDIQVKTHDSIEDARTALKLYRKYLEFDDAGVLDTMLQDIYRRGRETNFKPPRGGAGAGAVQRTDTPPPSLEGGAGLADGGGTGPSTPAARAG